MISFMKKIFVVLGLLMVSGCASVGNKHLVKVFEKVAFDTKKQRYVFLGNKKAAESSSDYWEYYSIKRENAILDSLEIECKKKGKTFTVIGPVSSQ